MSRDMGRVGWHRLSKRLTMRDVAEQAGWCDEHGTAREKDMRRAVRWLSRLESGHDVKLLFGEPGQGNWTTLEALRKVSSTLVESDKADAELLGDLEDQLLGTGIRLRALRAAVAENRRRIESLEASFGVRLEV